MCLAVPGKLIAISSTETSPRMAKADIGGVIREICIDWLPDLKLNEYVMIHAGYALEKIEENEARKQINLLLDAEETIKKKMGK